MALKWHYWFKSYGNFADWMDLAYWLMFSGEGSATLRPQPVQQACFDNKGFTNGVLVF